MPKLESIQTGEMRVAIARPPTALPDGLTNVWGDIEGRKHWLMAYGPSQTCNVRYEVLKDPALLGRMVERARGNKSGVSVRGPARASYGGKVELGLEPNLIVGYVRSAANNDSRRRVDGPVTVRVKRLEEPEPYTPTCRNCKQTLDAHEYVERVKTGGASVRDDSGKWQWDPEATRVLKYWLCPQE